MVRPGIKTKVVSLIAAATMEYLKYTGNSPVGAEFAYGCLRPALEDLLSFISEEDYHRLMAGARSYLREVKMMTTSTWDAILLTLSRLRDRG